MTGSATKQSIVTVALAVDSVALLLTMTTNINSHSRARYARGFARTVSPRENRGRRECRARNAPAASHAMKKAYEHSHHGHTGTTRHSPRNGFTAYFALSSVTTLFDTVACASYRKLDANDWGVRTTRLRRTQADRVRLARCRVHRIPPRVDDVAQRPSCRDRTGRISELIWVKRKQKYFCKRGLTRLRKNRSDLPVRQSD